MLLTEGQKSDHKGNVQLFPALPRAKELPTDKGYESNWFRAALTERGITPCKNRQVQYHYEKEFYRQLYKIENVIGRANDWHRVAT